MEMMSTCIKVSPELSNFSQFFKLIQRSGSIDAINNFNEHPADHDRSLFILEPYHVNRSKQITDLKLKETDNLVAT